MLRASYLGAILVSLLTAGSLLPARAALDMPRQNLSRYTPAQWTAAFQLASQLAVPQRIAFWADLAAVDSGYVADPLGEGPQQQPDPDPLTDFQHVDCVTYLEQVYALALSPTYDAFPATLQHFRYRDANIDYRWRNHYTVSDWLPANAWCIRDITDEVGAGVLQPMTKTISRGAFFTGKGLKQYADLPNETATTNYIPRDRVSAMIKKLQTGDMIIFVIDTPGIIAGHVGVVRMDRNVAAVQHASLSAKAVVTTPLVDYLRTAPARFVGFKIARPFVTTPTP